MYATQIPCFLMNEKRYVIALTAPDQEMEGHQLPLGHLRWKSFMSRSLTDESLSYLPVQNYSIKREDKYQLPLKIRSRSREVSIYDCGESPLQVSLLHSKNQEYEYPNEGNLVSALETFQTILQWKEEN